MVPEGTLEVTEAALSLYMGPDYQVGKQGPSSLGPGQELNLGLGSPGRCLCLGFKKDQVGGGPEACW